MGKISPQENWQQHVLERLAALRRSRELDKLREQGLAILGRQGLYTADEWVQTFSQRANSQEYRPWYDRCRALAEAFGINEYVVLMLCLVEDYEPEEQSFVIEADWPRIRIVTESTDAAFLLRLSYEAQRVGLHVVQRIGSQETTCIYPNPVPISLSKPPPLPSVVPPMHSAFRVRVETPTGFPPEAAADLQKKATQLEKEIRRRLGYPVRQRLRRSGLVSQAEALKVDEERLPSGGIYDVVDDVYGDDDDMLDDTQRRNLIKSRRYQLRKHLKRTMGSPELLPKHNGEPIGPLSDPEQGRAGFETT